MTLDNVDSCYIKSETESGTGAVVVWFYFICSSYISKIIIFFFISLSDQLLSMNHYVYALTVAFDRLIHIRCVHKVIHFKKRSRVPGLKQTVKPWRVLLKHCFWWEIQCWTEYRIVPSHSNGLLNQQTYRFL